MTIEELQRQERLIYSVQAEVAQNPEFFAAVVSAANTGQKMHIETMRKRMAELDRGWLLALSTLTTSRVDPNLKAMLLAALEPILAYNAANSCAAEKDAMKLAKAAREEVQ